MGANVFVGSVDVAGTAGDEQKIKKHNEAKRKN